MAKLKTKKTPRHIPDVPPSGCILGELGSDKVLMNNVKFSDEIIAELASRLAMYLLNHPEEINGKE